jgi:hypothetical protein
MVKTTSTTAMIYLVCSFDSSKPSVDSGWCESRHQENKAHILLEEKTWDSIDSSLCKLQCLKYQLMDSMMQASDK